LFLMTYFCLFYFKILKMHLKIHLYYWLCDMIVNELGEGDDYDGFVKAKDVFAIRFTGWLPSVAL
jgi:hypothetical protein